MAMQSLALSIVLFMFIIWFFLAFFTKETENNSETEVSLDEEVASQVDQEVAVTSQFNEEVVSQQTETEAVIDQELLPKEKNSTDLEEERNVGDFIFRIRRFSIHKKGLSEAECEDKNALSLQNDTSLRIAIADGATESLFSDIWADILVNSYVEKGTDLFKSSELESVNQKFVYTTSKNILQMPETRQWFMYEKLERGTHATLAAVEFSSPDKMQILTIGDSCVFWSDGNVDEINMLPEITAEEFGSFPISICHLPKTWQSLEQKILKKEVTFQKNLQMVLCTDALACWLVTESENKSSNWEKLFQISDYGFFTNFIETLREQNSIRNDDVTLVLINVLPFNV